MPLYDPDKAALDAGYAYHAVMCPDFRFEFYRCPLCAAMVQHWATHQNWHREALGDEPAKANP